MSLRWADDPAWHNDPGYSPAVAAALLNAYLLISSRSGDIRVYRDAYWCVWPLLSHPTSRRQRMQIAYVLALASSAVDDYQHAVEWLDMALDLAERLGDRGAAVDLLYLRGSAHRAVSRLRKAADDYQTCIMLLRSLGEETALDTPLLADLVTRLAGFEVLLGRYEHVDERLREAGRLVALDCANSIEAATVEWMRALIYRLRGQPDLALRPALTAAGVYAEYGPPASTARLLALVADIALDLAAVRVQNQRDTDRLMALAESHCERALRLTDDAYDKNGFHVAMLSSARFSRIAGMNEDRISLMEGVLRDAERVGDAALMALALTGLGEEFAARGEAGWARACYRSVVGTLDGTDMPGLASQARRALLMEQEMSVG
jgi:tetratricopeptide (TPR) repeat protein